MRRLLLIGIICCFGIGAAASEKTDSLSARVYLVGNAHLDSQWRWTVQQSISEYLPNTMLQNFSLFEEFPDYVFNFEGACRYAWMKEYYPLLFGKVKDYVSGGNWHLSGSSWESNDVNIPSTESAFRNILLGQEFFKSEFGRKSTDIMLPDCFGFGWTLPSVAVHCGLIGFSTQKLSWRHRPLPGYDRKYPFEFGVWEGVDGSEILAAPNGGGYGWNPRESLSDNPELQEKIDSSSVGAALRYYGTRSSCLRGDRGGSPLPRTVANMLRSRNKSAGYEIKLASSDEIFKDYGWAAGQLPVHRGELQMDVHSTGCFTSNAWMKRLNRRNEQLAYAAEAAAVMADWCGLLDYPKRSLNDAWKRFLWHQFHDDLTGTSIPEAYRFSYNDEIIAQNQFSSVIESSVEALASVMDTKVKGVPVLVYNPAPVRSREAVRMTFDIPSGFDGVEVYDPSGRRVKSQTVSRKGQSATLVFASDTPPLSLTVYDVRPVRKSSVRKSSALKVSATALENSIYKLSLDSNGDIVSVIDKRMGKELVGEGKSIGLCFFDRNRSDRWPSWEILKEVIDGEPSPVDEDVEIVPECAGELLVSLRIERRKGGSKFIQRISLTDGAVDDRVTVDCDVDWNSAHSLLKVSFPFSFSSPAATYDLGLGNIERGNNADNSYEVCAYQWADLSSEDGEYGAYIASDSKYGWDKPDDSTLRLTLLHTPSAEGDWFPHQGSQDLCRHNFSYSFGGHPGALSPETVSSAAEAQNHRKMAFTTSAHSGKMGKVFSMLSSSSSKLMIRSLKKAEDGDGYIIRVYEMSGSDAVEGEIVFPTAISSAEQVNGIEESLKEAEYDGNELYVRTGHFSPESFRVRLSDPAIDASRPSYTTLSLPFNKMAITSDAFCSVGQMDPYWHSYAAELLPDTLVHRGVPFVFGKADFANSLRCTGQRIKTGGGCDGVFLLVASAAGETSAAFGETGSETAFTIPDWTGFFGSCEWRGHYKSFKRNGDIAYVGTHRHCPGQRNEPYVFTYMYMIYVPLNGGSEFRLPDNPDITIFAVTAFTGGRPQITPVSEMVTSIY